MDAIQKLNEALSLMQEEKIPFFIGTMYNGENFCKYFVALPNTIKLGKHGFEAVPPCGKEADDQVLHQDRTGIP